MVALRDASQYLEFTRFEGRSGHAPTILLIACDAIDPICDMRGSSFLQRKLVIAPFR
jgi:hypothetical protein